MPQVMPEGFDPFAQNAPKTTVMPQGFDPFKQQSKGPTYVSPDGSAAIRNIFPGAKITSGHRDNNIGPRNDWHHTSNAAVDLEPISGETFESFTAKLKKAGYPIVQAMDEVKHPSKWATGPHWHVVLGARETPMAPGFDPFAKAPQVMPSGFDPFKSPQKGSKAPRGKDTPQRQNRAPTRSSAAPGDDISLGRAVVEGVENIPKSAVNTVKGIASAVRHPIETAEGIGDFFGGGMTAAMDAMHMRGTTPRGERAKQVFREAIDPFTSWNKAKHQFAKDPVGTALTVVPAAGAVGKVGKLGLRGVEAARLASLSPEARAALRAKRIEDAAVATHYKNMARPIMAQHRLEAERATAELRKHQKTIGNLPPEEQRKIAIAADTGDRSEIAPEHHGALDTIRDVAKRYEKRIREVYAAGGHNLPEFVEHYYKHWWHPSTTKAELDEFLKKRQGSSASLKHRSIPTLAEGIAAGLRPRYENPLDTMTHYAHQISGHLVNHDLMNAMRKDQVLRAKWVPKRSVPDGYRKLEGIGTEREGRGLSKDIEGQQIHTGNAPPMVLAAKDAAARLYNRRVTKGLTETVNDHFGPKAAKVTAGFQKGAHALVSTKLFSAFHPVLITGKGYASELGNGLRHLTRGAPIDTIKSLAHMPFAPAIQVAQGIRMGNRLLKGEEAMTEIDKLYREAGGSVKTGTAYNTVDAPSHLESLLRGTFKADLKKSLADIKSAPISGVLKMAGRAIDSYNDPIFKHYIPAIKRGAFERELSTSLKAHPEWTDAQRADEARRVMSSIEGRMGLMTRDNMFWSNLAHDIGRVIFLSPSWQLGNARMVEQALKEVPESIRSLMKGKGITQGPAQMAGLLGSYMLGNAVTQYLYTGQKPEGLHDLVAARTGGTNAKDGTPERVMMPSVMKELYEYFTGPTTEAGNVLNPALKTGFELWNNRDWSDTPIVHPKDAPWEPGDESRAHELATYLGGAATPIPFGENPNGSQSRVGAGSAFLGFRPVSKRWSNPEGYQREQEYFAGKDMARLRKRERKAKK